MTYRVVNFTSDDEGQISAILRRETGTTLQTVHLVFFNFWTIKPYDILDEQEENQARMWLDGIQIIENETKDKITSNTLEYDVKNMISSFIVNVPRYDGREILLSLINAWARWANCPLEARTIPQPGHPLLVLYFNERVIRFEDVRRLFVEFLAAIRTAVVEVRQLETDVKSDEDQLYEENWDENDVVEFELEEDVQQKIDQTHHLKNTVEDADDILVGEITTEGEEE